MVSRTRSDLVSKIVEALTGEALPRRQSTNVEDRRGEPKPKNLKPFDGPRRNATMSAADQARFVDKFRKRASDQHKRAWGDN